jgi:hypothetical protein
MSYFLQVSCSDALCTVVDAYLMCRSGAILLLQVNERSIPAQLHSQETNQAMFLAELTHAVGGRLVATAVVETLDQEGASESLAGLKLHWVGAARSAAGPGVAVPTPVFAAALQARAAALGLNPQVTTIQINLPFVTPATCTSGLLALVSGGQPLVYRHSKLPGGFDILVSEAEQSAPVPVRMTRVKNIAPASGASVLPADKKITGNAWGKAPASDASVLPADKKITGNAWGKAPASDASVLPADKKITGNAWGKAEPKAKRTTDLPDFPALPGAAADPPDAVQTNRSKKAKTADTQAGPVAMDHEQVKVETEVNPEDTKIEGVKEEGETMEEHSASADGTDGQTYDYAGASDTYGGDDDDELTSTDEDEQDNDDMGHMAALEDKLTGTGSGRKAGQRAHHAPTTTRGGGAKGTVASVPGVDASALKSKKGKSKTAVPALVAALAAQASSSGGGADLRAVSTTHAAISPLDSPLPPDNNVE